MMRYGKAFGTLDAKVKVIHLMGSEKEIITPEVRKRLREAIMRGEGIVGQNEK